MKLKTIAATYGRKVYITATGNRLVWREYFADGSYTDVSFFRGIVNYLRGGFGFLRNYLGNHGR